MFDKMENWEAKMKKTKLVTLCSTKNNDFGSFYPLFKFDNVSRSEKSTVKVTVPQYPDNVVYYELFDKPSSLSCNRLSFIFVGADSNTGETCHQFKEYKDTLTVDFSKTFVSVKSLFQIISQLRRCATVRFFLDSENIPLSETDDRLARLDVRVFKAHSVKSLVIDRNGSIDSGVWKQGRTRLNEILDYAYACFPNLETVTIKMEFEDGMLEYGIVRQFCLQKQKESLVKHEITLKNGILTCEPADQRASKSTPVVTARILPDQHQAKDTQKKHHDTVLVGSIQKSTMPTTPTIQFSTGVTGKGFLQSMSLSAVKLEKPTVGSPAPTIVMKEEIIDEVEVLPMTPKIIPMVDIASDPDDEIPCTPPKQAKNCIPLQNIDIGGKPDTQYGRSLGSLGSIGSTYDETASESSGNQVTPPKRKANALKRIGSSYEDWESSTSSDEESSQSPPLLSKARMVEEIPPEILKSVNEAILQDILKQVNDKATEKVTSSSSNRKIGNLVEGIDFERPKRKLGSERSRKIRR